MEGGQIGLEITGVLARLIMFWWDGKFLSRLNKFAINYEMYLHYADDANMVVWTLPPGTRVVNGKLSILEE